MQVTWGIEWEYGSKPFTHTHRLPLQLLLLPNTVLLVLADRRVFAVNGCALACFLLWPVLFQENEKPTK